MLERAERKCHAPRIAELSEQLKTPPFPPALAYLWRAFWRLRRRKGGGLSGPNPLEWADFQAFVGLARFPLAPWEIDLIERLDDAWLASVAEQQQQSNQTTPADTQGVKNVLGDGHERRTVNRKGGEL